MNHPLGVPSYFTKGFEFATNQGLQEVKTVSTVYIKQKWKCETNNFEYKYMKLSLVESPSRYVSTAVQTPAQALQGAGGMWLPGGQSLSLVVELRAASVTISDENYFQLERAACRIPIFEAVNTAALLV